MKYIWEYFTDLNARRTGTGYGPLPIQYSEMLAYFELYGINIDVAELKIIEVLDSIAMQHYTDKIQKDMQKMKK